jgi:hypothetical protein
MCIYITSRRARAPDAHDADDGADAHDACATTRASHGLTVDPAVGRS